MEVHYPTLDAPATPEYVLAVMRECFNEAYQENATVWSLDADLADWRRAVEDTLDGDIEDVLEHLWATRVPRSQWSGILDPAEPRTVRDLCEWIAGRVRRPCIRPARLLGTACLSAGAFLTIRSMLGEAGASAATITPSTSLAPFTRRYGGVFFHRLPRLAPGAMPPANVIVGPLAGCCCVCYSVGVISLLLTVLTGSMELQALAAVTLLIAMFTGLLDAWGGPAAVTFGRLRTFRDLAKLVAEHTQQDNAASRATT